MKLDFLIPASPNDGFYSQIAMFRLSLDRLGGDYERARLVAVFGDEAVAPLPDRWQRPFERIEIRWADPAVCRVSSYRAQSDLRFELLRKDCDLAILCDADTIMCGPFSDDLLRITQSDEVAGVIAHYRFPWAKAVSDPADDWRRLGEEVIGRAVEPIYPYTLAKSNEPATPFYINLGFLAGGPKALWRLDGAMRTLRPKVQASLQNHFDAQVALALAVEAAGLRAFALPMRYNFPNDPIADTLYFKDLAHVVLIHYLRCNEFNRHHIFAREEEFRRLLDLELVGSNYVFQDLVRQITGGDFPFPAD